jgi:Periplasmic binding protein
LTVAEVHGLGLQATQGLVLTESYYWDLNDRTREFGERFFKRTGRMPNMIQAGVYSATLQYLKAVNAAGTKDADAVAKKLRELPVDDAFTANGHVQADGRMVSDLYLFEVKKPSESKRDWDFYNLLATGARRHGLSHGTEKWMSADKVTDTRRHLWRVMLVRVPRGLTHQTRCAAAENPFSHAFRPFTGPT